MSGDKLLTMSLIRQWVCLIVVCFAARALAETAVPPNIILITVDTTRADRMGFLGSDLGLTPNLDALARQSVVFTHAYSQAPFTAPSHTTILTGTYPQFHQVEDFQVPLTKDLPFAPAILKAHGYHTAAFVGSIVLDPFQGLAIGYERGFDTYDSHFHMTRPGEDHYAATDRRAAVVVEHALAWLSKHPPGPFFMWVHLYDPHFPYEAPDPFGTRYKSAPYDGEIAYSDSALGKLLDRLRAQGLFENSVIAMMSDHGESLGDHGEEFHGFFLYDATIHVPLLLKLPGDRFAGKRIDSPVGLVDVLPTILHAVGIEVPQEVQGESLLAMMAPEPKPAANGSTATASPPDRPLYSETEYGVRAYGWSAVRSLRTGKYLFIEAPRRELYDMLADPKAEHDLSASSKAVADTLQSQLDAFRLKTKKNGEAPVPVADPEAQEKLAALGYTAASEDSAMTAAAAAAKGIGGGDPKDKIEIGNWMGEANYLLEVSRLDEAIVLLKKSIAKQPDLWIAYAKLGSAETYLHNFPEAVKARRKSVELMPDSVNLHYELGKILFESQDYESAVPELEFVVAKMPESWKTHIFLAISYSRTNRLLPAIAECQKVLAVMPEQYGTNLLLGRDLVLLGNPEPALPPLTKAASIRPRASEPHLVLADAYEKLGRNADAERERALGNRLAVNGPTPGPIEP
jgi:arylsulfatase A-like enzyme/Flp pilus assembly protein TadD